jgi:hypothetical protein
VYLSCYERRKDGVVESDVAHTFITSEPWLNVLAGCVALAQVLQRMNVVSWVLVRAAPISVPANGIMRILMDKKPLVTAGTYFFSRDLVFLQLFAQGRKRVRASPCRVATFCSSHRPEIVQVVVKRRLVCCGVNFKPCNISEQRF